MKYNIKFSCGHTAEIQLFGKFEEREKKIKYYEEEGICPECYKALKEKEKKEEDEKMQFEAKDIGLPDLQGTEKQIAWANKIRVAAVNILLKSIKKEQDIRIKACLEAMLTAIGSEDSAARIINERENILRTDPGQYFEAELEDIESGISAPDDFIQLDGSFYVKALKEVLNGKEEIKVSEDVTLSPKKKTTDTLAVVTYTDDHVTVSSPKDYTVMQIVKGSGFRWSGSAWEMRIGATTGQAADRAAEVANKLLAAGVQVRVPAAVQESAVEGNYMPRCTRWFYARKDDQKNVYAEWGNDEDWYNRIINLSGAKYVRDLKRIRIPASSADEIEDFAELNGFQITDGAKKNMAGYRAMVTIVSPREKVEEEKPDEKEKLQDVLESSREVIEDLKDD